LSLQIGPERHSDWIKRQQDPGERPIAHSRHADSIAVPSIAIALLISSFAFSSIDSTPMPVQTDHGFSLHVRFASTHADANWRHLPKTRDRPWRHSDW
jgi:hypothetical protein